MFRLGAVQTCSDPYIVITPQFHSPQGHRLIKNAYHFQLPPPFPPKRLFRPVFISQSVSVSISFPTSAVHIPQTLEKRKKNAMDWAISLASPSAPPSFAPRPSAPRLAAPVAPVSARQRSACCAGRLLVAAACRRERRDRVARRADVKITDATGEKRVPGEKGEKLHVKWSALFFTY